MLTRVHRFGNFIGEAEESEEESQPEVNGGNAYLDDDEAEEEAAENNQQLMEVDGTWIFRSQSVLVSRKEADLVQRKDLLTLLCFTKTNNITLRRNKCMDQMSRLWYKRRMRSPLPNPLSRLYNRRSSPFKRWIYQECITIESL